MGQAVTHDESNRLIVNEMWSGVAYLKSQPLTENILQQTQTPRPNSRTHGIRWDMV